MTTSLTTSPKSTISDNKKYLVIGGNGFIGSWVVDELVRRGCDVTVFDRFTESPQYVEKPAREIVGDFLNLGDLEAALQGIDVVVHLLSTTTPATAEADPLLDIRTNVVGTIELLKLAVESGVKHVYFASSGGTVYGAEASGLLTEEHPALPLSPYGIGKYTIERYLDYFSTLHGLESTVMRIANPYGPRQHPRQRQGVIPIFLRNIKDGKPVIVYGDGTMTRDYLYVEDTAKMIADIVTAQPRHRVYNIGSGTSNSINELIDAISEVTELPIEIIQKPTPPTFVDHVSLSIDRFKSEFGAPANPTPLSNGIEKTWAEITNSKG